MDGIVNAPRIVIAGTGSGCGKTTVTCALLQALKNRGYDAAAFKSGPDYIDPMFHSEAIGAKSANIDLFFAEESTARMLFARHAGELNIVEGAMGYYDGLAMDRETASAYHVSKVLKAPSILVLNARGMALSAAAVVRGYQTLRNDAPIAGVILNHCSKMLAARLKTVIEKECGVKVYGCLPESPECALESRHLGLVTAAEIEDIREKLAVLAGKAEECINLDALIELMRSAEPMSVTEEDREPIGKVRIAVAKDKAFCFYYRDNLELLEACGAEIVPFSPLKDAELPDCDGLYIGGGYPELYAAQLAENESMRRSIRENIANGLPTIAECGGFMYLCRTMAGNAMTGVIEQDCENTGKLARFGYITLKAEKDSLLFAAGDTCRAHEFHYWDVKDPGTDLEAIRPNGATRRCAYVSDTLYAGYPHLYFYSAPKVAERFIRKCLERKNTHGTDH